MIRAFFAVKYLKLICNCSATETYVGAYQARNSGCEWAEQLHIIYIAPEYYSEKNLHRYFTWHYKKGLTTRVAPQVWVFTDQRLLDLYIAGKSKGYREYPPRAISPPPSPTPWYHSRTYYDENAIISVTHKDLTESHCQRQHQILCPRCVGEYQ